MKKKILIAVIAVSAATLILSTVITTTFFYRSFAKSEEESLINVLDAAMVALESGGTRSLDNLKQKPYRLTWILSDGTVKFDTKVDEVATAENHLDRKEVQAALKTGFGKSTRQSSTMLSKTLNIAKLVGPTPLTPHAFLEKQNTPLNTRATNTANTPNTSSTSNASNITNTSNTSNTTSTSNTTGTRETLLNSGNKGALSTTGTKGAFEVSGIGASNTSNTSNPSNTTAAKDALRSFDAFSTLDTPGATGFEKNEPSVLRISLGTRTAASVFLSVLPSVLAVFIVALILCAALAKVVAALIVRPINALDLENPLHNDAYEEIAPLLLRINKQNEQIATQIATLRQRELEFTKITSCMKEGLLLLDKALKVVTLNKAAKKLFEVVGEVTAAPIQNICHDYEVVKAIESALAEGHCEVVRALGERKFQLDATSILADEGVVGVVVLLFDVTDKIDAQNFRREFTANVSHELKTPLQGILGSAELLERGMVREDDKARFIGHIKVEAQRLIELVEDVIKLSALDEKANFPIQNVELLSLAKEAAKALEDVATKKAVTVSIEGENKTILGSKKLLSEIIYNLLDNAIKYNRQGGTVTLSIKSGKSGEHKALIKVADTGVGISDADAEHVFERFYRADKSHSSTIGGTGLGLSIVRHAVEFHKGKIELKSKLGEGSVFTVELPC